MTNKNSGKAEKGSRLYLQQYMVNAKEKLSEMIIATSPSLLSFTDSKIKIEWKSPLVDKDFYEYRDDFLDDLGLGEDLNHAKEKLREFWPKNGPQWDGLAAVIGKNGEKGILLVEAKAHLDETKSDLKADSQVSIDKIKRSIEITQMHYAIKPNDWTKNYYQLGNRIAFLYFMNEVLHMPTWLVLINFIDGKYKSTGIEEWLEHYHKIYNEMGIKYNNYKLLNNVIQIFPNPLDDNMQK